MGHPPLDGIGRGFKDIVEGGLGVFPIPGIQCRQCVPELRRFRRERVRPATKRFCVAQQRLLRGR